jgi:U2-associated protein SR140
LIFEEGKYTKSIKRDHAVRDSRDKLARLYAGESHPEGTILNVSAANTTDSLDQQMSANVLNIACLPLSTRQSQLREILAPYGDIVSVKIMTDKPSSREFVRRSASAIVTFEKPNQAEKAQAAIDGRYMGEGWRLKASWGNREQQKCGTPFPFAVSNFVAKDAPKAPFDASVPSQALSKSQLSRAPPPSSLLAPVNVPKWGQPQQLSVQVQRPHDPRALRRIHAVIEGVSEYGSEFEALLMEREKDNEDYAFLFDSNV